MTPIDTYLNPAGRIRAEMCSILPVGHQETLIADQNVTAEHLWVDYRWPCRIVDGPKTFKRNQTWQLEVLEAGPPETVIAMTRVV